MSIFYSVKRNTWLGEESKQDLHEIFGHDNLFDLKFGSDIFQWRNVDN